jgi:hypothetical protein
MDVDENFMATKMTTFICGNTEKNTDEFNSCDKESIAGPDNVAYVPGHDGLIIGVCLSVSAPTLLYPARFWKGMISAETTLLHCACCKCKGVFVWLSLRCGVLLI